MPTKKKVEAVEPTPAPDLPATSAVERDPVYGGFEDILAGRVVLSTSPVVQGAKVLPKIIGGKVEFDGLDYDKSPIYAGMNVICSYCGEAPRPDRVMHAYIPDNDQKHVIFVCSDYSCTNSHRKRFSQDGSVLPH